MKNIILTTSLSLLLTVLSISCNAIVLRHDVEPKNYEASWDDFPALAQFYIDGAHGTLIAPTWIVTAAHTTFCTDSGSTILVGGEKAVVRRRYIHPDHTPGVSHDFAMIELAEPITNITPAKLYLDDKEMGKIVTLIGAGGTGNGIEGQTVDNFENNGVIRKANNTIFSANGPLLSFIFNRGVDALPLEGISGGGDSGGPAFIKEGKDYIVIGVSSRGEVGSEIGKYGNREYYSRISFFEDWINNVMNGTEEKRNAVALPELKHLMPGLTKQNLTEICADIQISASRRDND